ncbi:MAG: 4Fe-4S dicluster domain-containing protein [bacterium]
MNLLDKKDLKGFIEELKKEADVFAPFSSDGLIFFKEIKDKMPEFTYLNTTIPLKSLFLPQTEELLRFNIKKDGIEITESPPDNKKRIIIGCRPCDAKALNILDKVFLDFPEDSFYKKRRENTIIISLLCKEPDKTCFCTSFGYDMSCGSDILMAEDGNNYYFEPITEKGKAIVPDGSGIKDQGLGIRTKTHISLDNLSLSFNSPKWEEISLKCLGCGICTYLCPTCYCFDIADEKNSRFRCWDSCAFAFFTKMVAHQPRKEQFQRFRNRIMHKFSYFKERFGEYACVGCGRCIRHCPVSMDILEVIEKSGVRRKRSGVKG